MLKPAKAVYIHIPWCLHKCPYCDFTVKEIKQNSLDKELLQSYQDCLLRDLQQQLEFLQQKITISSIYCGGGTPNLLPPAFYQQLFARIAKLADIEQNCEISLEANPTSDLQDYAQAGFNRVSIGVQSFSEKYLAWLERDTSPDKTRKIVEKALGSFPRVNVDVIYAMPRQTPEECLQDLTIAKDLGAKHISWYQLQIEPNSKLYSRQKVIQLMPETRIFQLYESGNALLEDMGFKRYEISAYSQESQNCKHNLAYWQFDDYLGLGLGSHAKLSKNGRVYRSKAYSRLETYLSRNADIELVEQGQLPLEIAMNNLRIETGIEKSLWESHGLDWQDLEAKLAYWLEKNILSKTTKYQNQNQAIIPSTRAWQWLDSILLEFVE